MGLFLGYYVTVLQLHFVAVLLATLRPAGLFTRFYELLKTQVGP
jgi:hypothetical protein